MRAHQPGPRGVGCHWVFHYSVTEVMLFGVYVVEFPCRFRNLAGSRLCSGIYVAVEH